MTKIHDPAFGKRLTAELIAVGHLDETGKVKTCRTGCPTQDHKSYAECARGLQVNMGMSGTTKQKAQDAELRAYKRAREQGIQPLGTKMHQVEDAMRKSDASGVAFGG